MTPPPPGGGGRARQKGGDFKGGAGYIAQQKMVYNSGCSTSPGWALHSACVSCHYTQILSLSTSLRAYSIKPAESPIAAVSSGAIT